MEVNTKSCIINGKKFEEFSGKLSQLKEKNHPPTNSLIFYKLEKR